MIDWFNLLEWVNEWEWVSDKIEICVRACVRDEVPNNVCISELFMSFILAYISEYVWFLEQNSLVNRPEYWQKDENTE